MKDKLNIWDIWDIGMKKSDLGSIKFLRIKYGSQTNPFNLSFKRLVFINSFWCHINQYQTKISTDSCTDSKKIIV